MTEDEPVPEPVTTTEPRELTDACVGADPGGSVNWDVFNAESTLLPAAISKCIGVLQDTKKPLSECLLEELDLPEDCATCLAKSLTCNIEQCADGDDCNGAAECELCHKENCTPVFAECSGLSKNPPPEDGPPGGFSQD